MHAVVEFAEYHLAGGSLQHAGDGDIDGFGNHLLGVVHHHHGAVVQVGDSLVILLAFLEDEDAHEFAGQHDGLERVGQLIDVEHFHAVQLGHFVEVEIVGDHLTVIDLGELDQLHVDLAHLRKILFHNLYGKVGHFLHALQDVEPAAAAIALHGIGRIGHQLQFPQHELGNYQHAIQKSRLCDIGDAAIDDDAGVQNLVRLFGRLLSSENAAERGQIQHVALRGADNQADISHDEQQGHLQERRSVGFT